MTWHCNWSEDCDWFAKRIETVLGTKCLSVVVLVLGLMLRVLVAVVAVTLALRRTCASLDIRAEEEVAFIWTAGGNESICYLPEKQQGAQRPSAHLKTLLGSDQRGGGVQLL